MQHIERKFKNTHKFVINELQKLEKACDILINFQSEKKVLHDENPAEKSIKLGAIRIFKCVLGKQLKSLDELHQTAFSRAKYGEKFKSIHLQVIGLANQILSKETPTEKEQYYGSFNQHLKCIDNIFLPYSKANSSEKVTLQGKNCLFFERKQTTETIADDVFFKIQRVPNPSLMTDGKGSL